MLTDIPKARGEGDARGPGKALPGAWHQEMGHDPGPQQTTSPRARHPALLPYGHGRPADRDRGAEATMLPLVTEYLRREMVSLKAGRVMQNPGWSMSAHAPCARDDPKMGERRAGPG